MVDDDRDIREAIQEVLEHAGHRVICASDGARALAYLEEAAEIPGLILLDLMMPVKDGWQFRAEQLAEPKWQDIPVVIISAGGNVEQKAHNLSANGWLRKPLQIQTLLVEVHRALKAA